MEGLFVSRAISDSMSISSISLLGELGSSACDSDVDWSILFSCELVAMLPRLKFTATFGSLACDTDVD